MELAIPIFLFHRVGPLSVCRFTVPLKTFEYYLEVIDEEGYVTLTCSDLVKIALGNFIPPRRACILTFDDGYADFYVYAAPLLRRRGMRASIFIIANRTENGKPRLTLEDMWAGHCQMKDLYAIPDFDIVNFKFIKKECSGSKDHITWEELELLKKDGICDIQNHGWDHMCHFISPKICGFLNPQSHWTAYAANTMPWHLGTPIYEINSMLVAPRYLESKRIHNFLSDIVEKQGGLSFFTKPSWKKYLYSQYTSIKKNISENWETEYEWKNRVLLSLSKTNTIIGANLSITPTCLAWPFGRFSYQGANLATQAGIQLMFTTKGGGYIEGISPTLVGRINFKKHDVELFRQTLLKFSHPEEIKKELSYAIYNHPLEYAK